RILFLAAHFCSKKIAMDAHILLKDDFLMRSCHFYNDIIALYDNRRGFRLPKGVWLKKPVFKQTSTC
ncbi:hypothetical protein AIT86_004321, partial [Salmonella enterica subsp. houtenae]